MSTVLSAFTAIDVAGSGMKVYRTMLDATSDNIANVNTATPTSGPAFQARYVEAQSVDGGATGGGVRVAGIGLSDPQGRLTYSPTSPVADAQGYVRYPDQDLADQMTNLIMAQRGFQANAAVADRALDSYKAAINLGRN